jgi:hypothetical protein
VTYLCVTYRFSSEAIPDHSVGRLPAIAVEFITILCERAERVEFNRIVLAEHVVDVVR